MTGERRALADELAAIAVQSVIEEKMLDPIQILDTCLSWGMSDRAVLLAKALHASRGGRFEEVEDFAGRVLDSDPSDEEARYLVAQSLGARAQHLHKQIEVVEYIRSNDMRMIVDAIPAIEPQLFSVQRVAGSAFKDETVEGIGYQVKRLRELNPFNFSLWAELFFNSLLFYTLKPDTSCAVDGNLTAQRFRDFTSGRVHGPVLDIGCGPYGTPLYLRDVDRHELYGIDPSAHLEEAPFHFVRGFNEFLPFKSGVFKTVVNCTSLDHCIDLDRCLEETRRVLAPDGRFLVLIGNTPGAMIPDLKAPNLKPIDKFHLFHFHKEEFESIITPFFRILDVVEWGGAVAYELGL